MPRTCGHRFSCRVYCRNEVGDPRSETAGAVVSFRDRRMSPADGFCRFGLSELRVVGMEQGATRVIVGLAGAVAADGAFNAIGLSDLAGSTWWGDWVKKWTKEDLDHLEFPERLRFVFPILKAASVMGLLGGLRWNRLGRLTGLALIIYFVLAVGAHVRVRDSVTKSSPAVVMLAWCYVAWRAFAQASLGSSKHAASATTAVG